MPKPNIVSDISKEELLETVNRVKEGCFQENGDDNFQAIFNLYTDDYYRDLLKLNFKKYNHNYFNRQKGESGSYFEYTAEEIAERIWD